MLHKHFPRKSIDTHKLGTPSTLQIQKLTTYTNMQIIKELVLHSVSNGKEQDKDKTFISTNIARILG